MEFEVVFSGTSVRPAVQVSPKHMGLRGLDWVREELEIPCLDAALVDTYTTGRFIPYVSIQLQESEARLAGALFHDRNRVSVVVNVPGNAPEEWRPLNGFIKQRVRVQKDERTGAVTRAWVEDYLDRDLLVDTWIQAGAPTEWTPPMSPMSS